MQALYEECVERCPPGAVPRLDICASDSTAVPHGSHLQRILSMGLSSSLLEQSSPYGFVGRLGGMVDVIRHITKGDDVLAQLYSKAPGTLSPYFTKMRIFYASCILQPEGVPEFPPRIEELTPEVEESLFLLTSYLSVEALHHLISSTLSECHEVTPDVGLGVRIFFERLKERLENNGSIDLRSYAKEFAETARLMRCSTPQDVINRDVIIEYFSSRE